MEAGVIELLALTSPIIIAGDDDQALYSQLRGASWDHIRLIHGGATYGVFELPFCMRCPEVVVGAVNDIIAKAREENKLPGRVPKPYCYFDPVKGDDSRRFPQIHLVETSLYSVRKPLTDEFVVCLAEGDHHTCRHSQSCNQAACRRFWRELLRLGVRYH